MKVAVTAVDNHMDALVDSRFGRAAFFLIVDSDSLEYEVIPNPNIDALGGAGVQSAQLVINNGITSLLTGKCGPKAFQALSSAGIQIYEEVTGTVREALEAYQNNQFVPAQTPGGKPNKPHGKGRIL